MRYVKTLRSTLQGGAAQRAGWMRRAVCGRGEAYKWDEDTGPDALASIAACERCPVIAQCLDYAVRLDELLPKGHTLTGIWGGTTHKQRAVARRRRRERARAS